MKYEDIKTDEELELWHKNQYMKNWIVIPLVLVILFLLLSGMGII